MAGDFNRPAFYTIRLQEQLGSDWAEWFDGMTLTSDDEGTLLAGSLPDQSALHGVIARIQRLGLQLVAINRLDQRETHNGVST